MSGVPLTFYFLHVDSRYIYLINILLVFKLFLVHRLFHQFLLEFFKIIELFLGVGFPQLFLC